MIHPTDLIETPPGEPPALITKLSLIEGEILTRLESEGRMNAHRIVREMPWRSESMLMAIGSLIRQGLVRGIQTGPELELELVRDHAMTMERR
jgi:hypothetical protein